jgi:hypothetical protein
MENNTDSTDKPEKSKTVAPGKLAGTEYVIPPGGSLALLALGYRGLEMWRKTREESPKENPPKD